MRSLKLDVPVGAEVLTYQMRAGRQTGVENLVFPELCVEEDGRRFAYDLPECAPAFDIRISKEELSAAEAARDAVVAGLADSLLDGDKVLFSADTVFKNAAGGYIFLYYPADPVPAELCRQMLPVARQVTFEKEQARNEEVRDILFWVTAAVCCYVLFVILRGATPHAWLISLGAYGAVCGAAVLYARFGRGRVSVAADQGEEVQGTLFGAMDFPDLLHAKDRRDISTEPETQCGGDTAEMFSDEVPELNWDSCGTASLVSVFDTSVVGSVDKDAYRIGRNPETCDFCVSDRFVNPVHAVITHQGADYAITDKCSRNGTFVDGTRLEPENPFPLYGNEEIRIGKEVFRFMITSD